MISRFDGPDYELLNLKDVIIKNFQVENGRLRKEVNVLKNKILGTLGMSGYTHPK